MNSRRIPGMRFLPTDEELVNYFLFRKINGHPMIQEGKIKDIDIYQYEPMELHDSNFDSGDGRMYFFTPIHMIRQNGQRAKRETKHGFWRASQKSINILDNRRNIIGTKMPLVYFSKSENATPQKTSWLMSEYRLYKEVKSSAQCGRSIVQRIALCVVYYNERRKNRSACSSFESHQDDEVPMIRNEELEMPNDALEPTVTQPVIPNSSPISYSYYAGLSDILFLPSSHPISNYNNTFNDSFSNPILVPPPITFSNPNLNSSPNLSSNTFSNPNIPSSFNPVFDHNPTFGNSFVGSFSTSSPNAFSSPNFSSSHGESTSIFLPNPKRRRFS